MDFAQGRASLASAEAETNDKLADELKTGSKSEEGRGRVAAAFFVVRFYNRLLRDCG